MAIVDSVMRLEPRGGAVWSVAYNPDGTRVATAGNGSTESHHVAVAEAPDALTEFGPRDGGDPVDQ